MNKGLSCVKNFCNIVPIFTLSTPPLDSFNPSTLIPIALLARRPSQDRTKNFALINFPETKKDIKPMFLRFM